MQSDPRGPKRRGPGPQLAGFWGPPAVGEQEEGAQLEGCRERPKGLSAAAGIKDQGSSSQAEAISWSIMQSD